MDHHTAQPRYPLASRLLRRRRSLGGAALIITLLLVCQASILIRNGGISCSFLDQIMHLTPCRETLAPSANGTFVRQVAFSPDSRALAVVTEKVTLWDVTTGNLMQTLDIPSGGIPAQASFSPDGTQLALAGSWGIQVVDFPSMHVRYTIPSAAPTPVGIAYSPDGRLLARSGSLGPSQGNDWQVQLFDAQNGQLVHTIPGHYQLNRYDLFFLPDSQHLLIWMELPNASPRVAGWIWDIQTQQFVTKNVPYGDLSKDAQLLLPSDMIGTVMTLSVTNDSYVVKHVLPQHCPGGWATDFLQRPDRLVSISNTYDDLVSLWPTKPTMSVCRLNDGQLLWQSEAQGFCIEIAPNNRVAAVCGFSHVQVWDIPSSWG